MSVSTVWAQNAPAEPDGQTVTVQATPGDDQDDTTAVLQAIRHCQETGARRLVFPKGRYDFMGGVDPNHPGVIMHFEKFKNLEIDGGGSEFIFHNITTGMQFLECEGVTVRNFTVDWARPPFSVGTVLATAPRQFDVQVFDEFPVKGGEPVKAFMDFDPKTRLQCRPAADAYDAVASTTLLRPQVLRLFLNRDQPMTTGTLAVLRHQVYDRVCFYSGSCRNIRFEDISLYAAPGMSLVSQNTENITLERYKVMIKPGTRRFMSATADATHFAGCSGLIRIKDCVFEGMGDDAVNIKTGLYLTALERPDSATVLAEHSLKMPSPPEVGESMELCHVDTMIPYATREVKSVELLHPDPAQPQNTQHRIVFTEPLPAEFRLGDVMGNSSRLVQVHISGCRVHANRPRGFLIQTRNALIENNVFESCMASGIHVVTEVTYFNESISAQNIIIRKNTFLDVNQQTWAEGAINVVCILKGFAYPPLPGVFKNIVIEENTIENTGQSGIFVSNTENLVIRNNKITGACQKPAHPSGNAAIALRACRNVVVSGNDVSAQKQGPGFKAALELGPGCVKESIAVEGNQGFEQGTDQK